MPHGGAEACGVLGAATAVVAGTTLKEAALEGIAMLPVALADTGRPGDTPLADPPLFSDTGDKVLWYATGEKLRCIPPPW